MILIQNNNHFRVWCQGFAFPFFPCAFISASRRRASISNWMYFIYSSVINILINHVLIFILKKDYNYKLEFLKYKYERFRDFLSKFIYTFYVNLILLQDRYIREEFNPLYKGALIAWSCLWVVNKGLGYIFSLQGIATSTLQLFFYTRRL